MCHAFGACDQASPGRVRRNTYVIDQEGIVRRIDEDVDPERQAETTLAFLRGIAGEKLPAMPPAGSEASQGDAAGSAGDSMKGEQRMIEEQAQANEHHAEGMEAVSPATASVMPEKEEPAKRPAVVPARVQPAQASEPSLVFALGMIGYDYGTQARRDSLAQHMGGNPDDPTQLLAYLEKDPSQAATVIWTLNLDATPIYAIQPGGPFAEVGYERLRQFLREQIEEGVERVSVPGRLVGQVQLMSGQVVPVIWPEPRCMYSWSTRALVEAVSGKPPADNAPAKEKEAYAERTEPVASFLERIYHELRNLGVRSQERATNYAAANAATVQGIFESALRKKLELYSIEAEPSPLCRPDSDCWDVLLKFFDPENVLRAKRVYRFTVDVSDVCPVMVGPVRSWSAP